MVGWERFAETLPDKNSYCNELYLEDIADKGYTYAQKVLRI